MTSKRIGIAGIVVLILVVIASCGGGDGGGDPRSWPTVQEMTNEDKQEIINVIEDFLPVLADLDFRGMRKYVTEHMAQEIERWEEVMDVAEEEGTEIKSIEITDIRLGDWDIELVEASYYSLDEQMPKDGWRKSVVNARALPIYHVKMVGEVQGEKQETAEDVYDRFELKRVDNKWLISSWEGLFQ